MRSSADRPVLLSCSNTTRLSAGDVRLSRRFRFHKPARQFDHGVMFQAKLRSNFLNRRLWLLGQSRDCQH